MAYILKLNAKDVKNLVLNSCSFSFHQDTNQGSAKAASKVIGGSFSFSVDPETDPDNCKKLRDWAIDKAKQPDGSIKLYDEVTEKELESWDFEEARLVQYSVNIAGSGSVHY